MKRDQLTEKILDIKRNKGWTWKHIAGEIGGMSPVLVVGALLGQMKLVEDHDVRQVPAVQVLWKWAGHSGVWCEGNSVIRRNLKLESRLQLLAHAASPSIVFMCGRATQKSPPDRLGLNVVALFRCPTIATTQGLQEGA